MVCKTKFPVVLFSHGDMGCGTQSTFITEQLARKGYIVIAPDSKDAACTVSGQPQTPDISDMPALTDFAAWNETSAVYRRDDLQLALSYVLNIPEFKSVSDSSNLALMGHSLGGYTAFGMIGGWDSWYDSRFKAAMLLSPFLQGYLDKQRANQGKTPMMFQGGTLDGGVTPWLNGTKGDAYDQAVTPKIYAEFEKAAHFAWTNNTCTQALAANVKDCLANVPIASQITNYVVDYFNYYLKGIPSTNLLRGSSLVKDYRRAL